MFLDDNNNVEETLNEVLGSEPVDADEKASEMLSEAVKRIEEANLFKLLIKSNVFTNDSADPFIVKSVNDKVKAFALGELEKLLGLRREQPKVETKVDLPFNDNEIQALKLLAGKILNKETQVSPLSTERKPEIVTVRVSEPQPNKMSAPQSQELPTKKQQQPQKKTKPRDSKQPLRANGVRPLPIVSDQIPNGIPGLNITGQSAGINLGNILGAIQQASGGNTIAVNDSQTNVEDINERF